MDIIKQVLNEYELMIEDDPDSISWEDELFMKKNIISRCVPEEFIEDTDIENIYVYEMFEWDLPQEILQNMAYVFLEMLQNHSKS